MDPASGQHRGGMLRLLCDSIYLFPYSFTSRNAQCCQLQGALRVLWCVIELTSGFPDYQPWLRFLESVKFIILCLYTFVAFKIYPCFLLSYSVLSLWVCLSLNNPFAALSVRRGEGGDGMPTLCSPLSTAGLDVYFHLPLSSEQRSDPGHVTCIVGKAAWSLPGVPLVIVPGPASSAWSWWYTCQALGLSLSHFIPIPKPVHHSLHLDACGALSRHF